MFFSLPFPNFQSWVSTQTWIDQSVTLFCFSKIPPPRENQFSYQKQNEWQIIRQNGTNKTSGQVLRVVFASNYWKQLHSPTTANIFPNSLHRIQYGALFSSKKGIQRKNGKRISLCKLSPMGVYSDVRLIEVNGVYSQVIETRTAACIAACIVIFETKESYSFPNISFFPSSAIKTIHGRCFSVQGLCQSIRMVLSCLWRQQARGFWSFNTTSSEIYIQSHKVRQRWLFRVPSRGIACFASAGEKHKSCPPHTHQQQQQRPVHHMRPTGFTCRSGGSLLPSQQRHAEDCSVRLAAECRRHFPAGWCFGVPLLASLEGRKRQAVAFSLVAGYCQFLCTSPMLQVNS